MRAVVLACLIAAAMACGGRPRPGDPAPPLALRDVRGDAWSLADERGHVVVLDFWATWCPPCREMLPALDALARRRADDGVRVVAVSIDTRPDTVVSFLRARLPEPALDVVCDPEADALSRLGAGSLPAIYVLDGEGRIRWSAAGDAPQTVDVVDAAVAGVLADGTAPTARP